MRTALTGLVAACLLIATGQGAYAQGKPKDHAKFQDRIEWMTMWKLIEALDLDRPTSDKVYEVRRKFLARKKELIKDINAEIESLRQELRDESGKVTDVELGKKIQSIRDKRKKLEGLLDDQFEELSTLLSIRQQAKMVLFMKDFREELQAMLRGPGMRGPHRPPGPGFGPPPPPGAPPPGIDPESGPEGSIGGPTPE